MAYSFSAFVFILNLLRWWNSSSFHVMNFTYIHSSAVPRPLPRNPVSLGSSTVLVSHQIIFVYQALCLVVEEQFHCVQPWFSHIFQFTIIAAARGTTCVETHLTSKVSVVLPLFSLSSVCSGISFVRCRSFPSSPKFTNTPNSSSSGYVSLKTVKTMSTSLL